MTRRGLPENAILELQSVPDLLAELHWNQFGAGNRIITPQEIKHIFEICGALWLHSGDPTEPHAELTGGKCSNGFCDTLRVLQYTQLCMIFGLQLARKWIATLPPDRISMDDLWVIGSDHAGADISMAVANFLPGARHHFTEKGPEKTQLWKRFAIPEGDSVLQIEELVTTTGTLRAVREGIRVGNPVPVKFEPVALTLVHRSNDYQFDGGQLLYLVHWNIQTWTPAECPLCDLGSRRLRPKEHWAELTRRG